jgi:hypothetical protein
MHVHSSPVCKEKYPRRNNTSTFQESALSPKAALPPMRSDSIQDSSEANKGTHNGAHARTRRASTPPPTPDRSRPDIVSHRLTCGRGHTP